jgi:DNA-binding MarR family transcriptional regulator
MSERQRNSVMGAWSRLIRAQQNALGGVETALKKEGFPPLVWYDVLLELERAPGGSLRHKDIEREMLLQRYHVSRVVERMEREGLLERQACPDDARGAVAVITEKGKALRRRMWPVYAAAVDRHFARHFTSREIEQLGNLLSRLS